MNCEKCKSGQMVEEKIYRLSGCLAALGYILLIPSILGMLLSILLSVIGTTSTGAVAGRIIKEAKTEAVDSLKNIEGLPTIVISDFEPNGTITNSVLNSLNEIQREQVSGVMRTYSASVAGASVGAGGVAFFGGAFVIMLFIISIPTFIVGFLLILKKKVWKCTNCGFIFERA